jgi:fibrillarin-like pre-rRNA processing protein
LFLKKNGYGLLAVKARSIDVKRKPSQIFQEVRTAIEKQFTVIDFRVLEPFEKDHCMIIIKK